MMNDPGSQTISIVGERLRKARCERGLSQESVSQDTKIHVQVIDGLERETIVQNMSQVYVRGFLKRYAEYLGFDSSQLLNEFFSVHAKLAATPVIPQEKKEFNPIPLHIPRPLLTFGMKLIFVGVLVVLFIWQLSFIRSYIMRPFTRAKKKPVAEEVHVLSTDTLPAPASSVEPEIRQQPVEPAPAKPVPVVSPKKDVPKNTPTFPLPAQQPIELTLTLSDACWMQIKSDGTIVFQGVLVKGDKETWRAEKDLELWFGNAGGVTIGINGAAWGVPGKRGQVMKGITITHQKITLP